jgi:hypothetical protein
LIYKSPDSLISAWLIGFADRQDGRFTSSIILSNWIYQLPTQLLDFPTPLPSRRRVRIIRTTPSSRPSTLLVSNHNLNNRPIRPPDHQESPNHNDEHTPPHHQLPLQPFPLFRVPIVVVQPHEAHRLERHESAQQGADERDQPAEDGNGAGDNVGDQDAAAGAAQPDGPVGPGIVGQVAGAAEEADEDVFGGELGGRGQLLGGDRRCIEDSYMGDDCHGDYEARECQAVADFLHRDSCGA